LLYSINKKEKNMPLTVVVGGQYGGEGKGKITSYLSMTENVDCVVRCGGPNSGHTVDFRGKRFQLRLLPAGFINSRTRLLLAAGAIVNPRILFQEMEICKVDQSRIGVDFNTGIITEKEARLERQLQLKKRIGSTQSGTGIGVASRVLRDGSFKLAKEMPSLKPFLTNVSTEVNSALDKKGTVIIEGTQGFGLSLYHSGSYPFATSRDTTAAAFLSEVGVSPIRLNSVIMVIRTFPIRVSGNSGPLKKETTWDNVQKTSGYPYKIREFTTVTKRLRRVAQFDIELVEDAAAVNKPTEIALNGVDYLDYRNKGITQFDALVDETKEFICFVENTLKTKVRFIGTGPTNEEIIDRRSFSGKCILEREVVSISRALP
jgi:adenylosuccinate synthase